MNLKIPLVNMKAEKFDFQKSPYNPVELATDMVKMMYDNGGIGLSMIQIEHEKYPNTNYAVFSMRGKPHDFVFFNPRVVQPSAETVELEESCLSYPNLVLKITRPRHIRVRFQGPNGDTYTETFANLTARVFLHEMDHLNGVPFWSSLSKIKFDLGVRRAKKKGNDYSHVTYKGG